MGKLAHFSLLLGGVLAAWGLWLSEVCWIKGWAGLAWLSGFNWSALPICALIAVTASYGVSERVAWRERMIFTAVAWVIALAGFVLVRWAAFDLFSRSLGVLPTVVRWEPFITAAFAGSLVSAGLTFAANRWLAAMHYWTGFLLAAGLLDATVDCDHQDSPGLERQRGRDPFDQDGLPRFLDCHARFGRAVSWAQEAANASCSTDTTFWAGPSEEWLAIGLPAVSQARTTSEETGWRSTWFRLWTVRGGGSRVCSAQKQRPTNQGLF